MDFESFQYVALLCVGTFFALSPLSWVAHRDAARSEGRKLTALICEAVLAFLPAGSDKSQLHSKVSDVLKQIPLRISTRRTFLLHLSHLLFVAFFAHLLVCFIVFASSGQGKAHVHASYGYATWFGVAYLVSVILYMCVEETYRWVYSFATGGALYDD